MSAVARRLLSDLDASPRLDLALRLTLVALLLSPIGGTWSRPLISLACAAGLLFASLLRRAAFWAGLLGLAAWRVVARWPIGDNHSYLLCYWLLAAWIATRVRDGDRVLAWNGRALIGLVFAFATLWKVVLSPDYLDGRFFAVTLVDDARLRAFTQLVVDLDPSQLDALGELVREHQDGVRAPRSDDPLLPARLVAVAHVLTWGLVALESAVAFAFLVPAATWLSRARDLLLLAFCAGTYTLAPVPGFGWLLVCMGIAQCEPGRVGTRRAYAAVFAWILLASRWPWLRVLAS